MNSSLQYESIIEIENIPVQWGQKFELYYPDLPGFPIVYVHFTKEKHRVYGFPINACFKQKSENTGSVELTFISNIDLDVNLELKALTKKELENRFGARNL